MKDEQLGKPIIAIVNSFTQFVPGHTHLHEAGQLIKKEIEEMGCFAAEFNTIAIDDGIAMGHDGMLYSLPSRDLIADSVEYMVQAHKADAMVCISNCDKVTPGMLLAAMRLNIPTIFVSGGPMEAGEVNGRDVDLIDIMIESADPTVDDSTVDLLEKKGCPTCGSCSGMFTANSMNSLNEAIGLALPGNGTVRHPRQSPRPDEEGRPTDCGKHQGLLLQRRQVGATPLHRLPSGISQRHGSRHSHGRLDQHSAPSARRGPRGRR